MSVPRATSILTIARAIAAVIVFVATAVFAQLISKAALGQYFLFESAIWILATVADVGYRQAIEKRMSENTAPGEILTTGLLLKLPVVLLAAVIISLASPFLQQYISPPLLGYLPFAIVLHEATLSILAILSGEHRASLRAPLQIGQYTTWVLLGVFLVSRGWGAEGLVISWLAGYFVVIVCGAALIKTRPTMPAITRVRPLTRFAVVTMVGSLASIGYNWADILLIGALIGPTAVANYEVAWRVSMLALLIPTAMRTVYVPEISRLHSTGNFQKIHDLLSESVFLALLIPIPMTVGAVLIGPDLLAIFFGDQYRTAATVLVLLCLRQCIAALSRIFGPSIEALDRPELVSPIVFVSLLLNVGLNILLIPIWGLIGATVATGVSTALQTLIFAIILRRLVDLDITWFRSLKPVLIGTSIMCITVVGANRLVKLTVFPKTLLLIVVGVMAFSTVIGLTPQSRYRVRRGFFDRKKKE